MPLSTLNNKKLMEAAKTNNLPVIESLFSLPNDESPSQNELDAALKTAVSNNALQVVIYLAKIRNN